MLRNRSAIFLLVYLFAVLYVCLYPWQFISPPRTAHLLWVPFRSARIILDFILNVLLYIPLGAAAILVLGRRGVSLPLGIALGFVISLGVEWTQRYVPFRSASFNDLLANTLGTGLGALTALAWKRKLSEGSAIAILWIVWNGFLLLPMISHAPWPPAGLDADYLFIGTINTFLGFLVLSLSAKPRANLVAVLALLPAAALWTYPALLLSRLAAAFGALALAHWVKPLVSRLVGFACLIWLVFQEFYPFNFERSPKPFSSIPFEGFFSSRPEVYYPAIFGKLFFYTAVVWAVRHQGANLRRAFMLPGAFVLAGEIAQRYLPGRAPELTDLVLLAAGTFMLWLAQPTLVSRSGGKAPAGVGYEVRGAKQ